MKKIIITIVVSYVVSLTQTNAGNSGSTPDKPSSLKATGQLLEAERAGDIEIIKMLLKNGFNINSKETPDGATVLMWAAVQGDTDMINLLLDKGADVNATNNVGMTALMGAAFIGKTNGLALLLAKGADINARQNDGKTALLFAADAGHIEAVKFLLARGADGEKAAIVHLQAWLDRVSGKTSIKPVNSVVASGTNTDSSGFVTNVNLLKPFTLTNSYGDVITNAILVMLTPNKFVYKISGAIGGGGGTRRLDSLSTDLQVKFGYDPQTAQAADEADRQRLAHQQEVDQQQREAAQQGEVINKALQTAKRNGRYISGKVIQKIGSGLLVSFRGTQDYSGPTILVRNYPKSDTVAADDYINFGFAFQVGLYSYTTVNNSENTIRAYTCSQSAAVEYYLAHP